MPPDGKTSHGLQPVEQKKKNEVKYVMMKFIETVYFPQHLFVHIIYMK